MDLGNPFKVVVNCLLTGGMIGIGHRDEVLMVSALVCTITR